MAWNDQIDSATVQRVLDTIGDDAVLRSEATTDLNGFLARRMQIESPVRLKLHEMPYGWFVCPESEPVAKAFGYKIELPAANDSDELSDSELDLVSAGTGIPSTASA
jgi:hypothetical protein